MLLRTRSAGEAALSATGLTSRARPRDDVRDLARPDGPPQPAARNAQILEPVRFSS